MSAESHQTTNPQSAAAPLLPLPKLPPLPSWLNPR
jgi:hypothetical protein